MCLSDFITIKGYKQVEKSVTDSQSLHSSYELTYVVMETILAHCMYSSG